MADTATTEEILKAFISIESLISENFKAALATDAMLNLELEFQDVKPIEPSAILAKFSGSCQIFSSAFAWNVTSNSHFFFLPDEDANALLAEISTQNEAIDNLDAIFENWNAAAVTILQEKLGQAPSFEGVQIDSRELSAEDFPDDGWWLIYNLQLGENTYQVNRIVPIQWQEIVEMANIDVTTVDNLETSLPKLPDSSPGVENVEFGDLQEESAKVGGSGSLELLYDLKLDMVVELGRTRKPIREILDLGRGSIIELEKLAGDPVEIFVNDKKLAEGEVVVVDDHFGVRITNLVKPAERIRSLGSS